jgi:hypothetical protein
MQKLRTVTLRSATDGLRTMDKSHTFAAYVYMWYGLQSCRGESAGVAKWPRELISHPKPLESRFALCLRQQRRQTHVRLAAGEAPPVMSS